MSSVLEEKAYQWANSTYVSQAVDDVSGFFASEYDNHVKVEAVNLNELSILVTFL